MICVHNVQLVDSRSLMKYFLQLSDYPQYESSPWNMLCYYNRTRYAIIIDRDYVCLYECLHVCLYFVLLLLDTLYLGRQTFRCSSTTSKGRVVSVCFQIQPSINISMNNRIFLCSYYVQCYLINCVPLLTTCVFSSIVRSYVIQGQGVARHCYNYQHNLQFRELNFPEAIKILTGNTKYQGTGG